MQPVWGVRMNNSKSRLSQWMPFFFDDFRHKDSLLTSEQHIACLRLEAHYWLSQRPLPNINKTLAVISGLQDKWPENRGVILHGFFKKTSTGWVPMHLDSELEHAIQVSRTKSRGGQKSGEARRRKRDGNEHVFNTCSTHVEHNRTSTVQNKANRKEEQEPLVPLPHDAGTGKC